jgi:hypothetical protein
MIVLNTLPCGRGRLNIMFGSIRTRLSREILLRRSALAWIFRFFGAKFAFRRTPQRCRYGCRIFCFDPPKAAPVRSRLRMAGHAYFSSGTFACRRNAIPFDEWDRTESWARQSPGLFARGEIVMLNYLVHAMVQRKKLTLAMSDLQRIGGHHGLTGLKNDCADSDWHFPKTILLRGRRTFAGVNCFCLIGRLTRVPSRFRGWSIIVVSTPNSALGWQS